MCIDNWAAITNSNYVLDIIKGCKLLFNDNIKTLLQSFINQNRFSVVESNFLRSMICDLEREKVIEKTCYDNTGFLNSIFLVEKSNSNILDRKFRMILNMKNLNKDYILHEKFKLENLNSCLLLMEHNCFMASLDLKNAYHSIPIWGPHQKYLQFFFENQVYKYLVLPQGYKDSPRIFTRVLKPVLGVLRKKGILSSIYIDDLYLQGESFEECQQHVKFAEELLVSLGFEISEKSSLLPTQKITHLGFILDSVRMQVSLELKKQKTIVELGKKLLCPKEVTVRFLAKFIGSIVACFPAVRYGPLFYRNLELLKIKTLKNNNFDYESKANLNIECKDEIKWWIYEGIYSVKPIYEENPHVIIKTDSSNFAWGAVFDNKVTQGFWDEEESKLHINAKELLAACLGVKAFASKLKNIHVQVKMDNTTAVSYLNKMGGTHSYVCNNITKDFLLWCKDKDIWISATHIAGIDNNEADKCSRKINAEAEMSLHSHIFEKICLEYGTPEVDLFASRINCKLPQYYSRFADEQAFGIDAFHHIWVGYIYIFPPFILINRILSKILRDKPKKTMLIVPVWPTAVWYPKLMKMQKMMKLIGPAQDLISMPKKTRKSKKFLKKLNLMICFC